MASPLRVASWNTSHAFNAHLSEPRKIIDGIRKIDADVFVLPNSFSFNVDEKNIVVQPGFLFDGEPLHDVEAKLWEKMGALAHKLDYRQFEQVECADAPHAKAYDKSGKLLFKKEYLTMLSRDTQPKIARLATRNVLQVHVPFEDSAETLQIYGVLFDDYNKSSSVNMARAFLTQSDDSAVLIGDFNALPDDRFSTQFLRSDLASRLMHILPYNRTRELATHLTTIAKNITLEALTDGLPKKDIPGLGESERDLRATVKLLGIPIAEQDHAFFTPMTLQSSNYRVHHFGGSNHKAISIDVVPSDWVRLSRDHWAPDTTIANK